MECRLFNSKYYNKKCALDDIKESAIDYNCLPCLLDQCLGEIKRNQIKVYEKLKEILKEMKTIK